MASDSWRSQPRVPAGSPEGGQFASWSRAPKITRVWNDNPGGSWEQHQKEWAEKQRAAGRRVSGDPTAGFYGRLKADGVAALPGLNDEQKLTSLLYDEKAMAIKESIRREGVKRPVFINVNHRGEAWINEGNHRAAIAASLGHRTVPVQVSYFAGGEKAPGPMNLKSMVETLKEKRAAAAKVLRSRRGA